MKAKDERVVKITTLNDLLKNKSKYKLQQEKGHIGVPDNAYDGGEQGEYNETFVYYKHPELPENIFYRETYHTDSYGGNEFIYEVSFVEGKAKTITVFEPI